MKGIIKRLEKENRIEVVRNPATTKGVNPPPLWMKEKGKQ